jgi:DNA-binding transcriptional MerR regulator
VAYTVRRVSVLSGVSIRTLHFYDEVGLLKPAYVNASGYRYYEEPQLLQLQQILFLRELGLALRQIRSILGRDDFEKATALESHRAVLEEKLIRTRALITTIDKTIDHVRGTKTMSSKEMFAGFKVAAGAARFDEAIKLREEHNDCKVSGRDTGGAMCVFEFAGLGSGPRRRQLDQDEWIYVVDGELMLVVGDKQFQAGSGESIFVPKQTAYAWASTSGRPARIIDVYQPAGRTEDFFRAIAKYNSGPPIHEALSLREFRELFQRHGMEVAGPPLVGQWKITNDRIQQV